MTFASDLASLRSLRDAVFGPEWLDLLAEPQPQDVIAAAHQLLRVAYTESPPRRLAAEENGLVEFAAVVLGKQGGHGQRVWDEVVLRVAHPIDYYDLVPSLRSVLDQDDTGFFELLLDTLERDEPDVVARGLHLLRAAYSVRDGFHLTAEQVDALDRAVIVKKALGTDHDGLAAALSTYGRPAAR